MAKRRAKAEVANELTRLSSLRESEQFKLYKKLLMGKLGLEMKSLLTSQLRPDEMIASVIKARSFYEAVTMVPAEEYALEDELFRIEQEERTEVEADSRMRRSFRMDGAV